MTEEQQPKYLGDYVKNITTKIGIKSCIPCQARQVKMNQAHQTFLSKLQQLRSRFSPGS